MAQRCSCELTLALLARLGGPHARRMRAQGRTQTDQWDEGDWLAHIAEEERLFIPLLPPQVRRKLLSDHQTIREAFGHPRGRVSKKLATAHAELEDVWAEHLALSQGWSLHDHKAKGR